MLKLNAEIPTYAVPKWLALVTKTVNEFDALAKNVHTFMGRSMYNCVLNDGTPDTKSPVYHLLSEGTQEEADRHIVMSGDREWRIQEWSLAPFNAPRLFDYEHVNINGQYCPDPTPIAMDMFIQLVGLSPAKYIFASRDHTGECGDFFFHIVSDCYIRVTVSARYNSVQMYAFDGDPIAFAKTWTRQIRSYEFVDSRPKRKETYPCPVELPMTYVNGEWTNARPVTLKDLSVAMTALSRINGPDGHPWLMG